jgi:hypothetical protein
MSETSPNVRPVWIGAQRRLYHEGLDGEQAVGTHISESNVANEQCLESQSPNP